jgi:hypothetical protein
MFEPDSRYYPIETAELTLPDGRKLAYKRRRFLPQGKAMELLVEVSVTEGDRLDLITTRTLGDPQQFWRIADANDGMHPQQLTDEVGRSLRVPVPTVEEPK